MSVEGLKLLAGRAGGGTADLGASSLGVPPYLESDSPGRTKGVDGATDAWGARGAGAKTWVCTAEA
jgi:hypothetical protein